MSIDDEDIQELFERIAGHFENAGEGAKGMFSMLVSTTLKYRDNLVAGGEEPLNVAKTREALDVFMEVLKTHRIPDGLDRRVKDLVVLWFEELKLRIHH